MRCCSRRCCTSRRSPNADLGAPPWAAVLITSANGARALAAHPRRGELMALPLLAVGHSSADAARAAGFADVTSADGDAGDLARACGRGVSAVRGCRCSISPARTAPAIWPWPGVTVRTVVIYRAAKADQLPPDAQAALEQGRIDGVLHFSRRSVDSYLGCGGRCRCAPAHYCLSARAAEPLRLAGATRIHVAAQPDEASLLALVTPKS